MDYKLLIILFLIGTIPLFTGVMATDFTIQKDSTSDDLLNYTVYTNSYGVDQFWVDNNGFVYANGTLITGGTVLSIHNIGNVTAIGCAENEILKVNSTGYFVCATATGGEISTWTLDHDADGNNLIMGGGIIKNSIGGASITDIPTQVNPEVLPGIIVGGNYSDSGNGNLFQIASWLENDGNTNSVASFGLGIGTGASSKVWGGNFVGYLDAGSDSNAVAIGAEIDSGRLDASATGAAHVLVLAFWGGNGGTNYLQMQSGDVGSRPTDGIVFNGNLVNGGDLIKTTGSVSAVDGIDFSSATFSGNAITANGHIKGVNKLAFNGISTTISGGVITITTSLVTVDTEAAAGSDDLNTINGGSSGQILVVRAADNNHTVICKDSTGNLLLNGDFDLDSAHDTITLLAVGTSWVEIARSDNLP